MCFLQHLCQMQFIGNEIVWNYEFVTNFYVGPTDNSNALTGNKSAWIHGVWLYIHTQARSSSQIGLRYIIKQNSSHRGWSDIHSSPWDIVAEKALLAYHSWTKVTLLTPEGNYIQLSPFSHSVCGIIYFSKKWSWILNGKCSVGNALTWSAHQ